MISLTWIFKLKYYAEHPEVWEQFKADVGEQIEVVEQEVMAAEGE